MNEDTKKSHAVDVHLGARICERRAVLGWSQERLANALGLSIGHVRKYERGELGIPASRLVELADLLGVSLAYFFERVAGGGLKNCPRPMRDWDKSDNNKNDPFRRVETLKLVRTYYGIKDIEQRKHVMEFMEALASRRFNG